MGLWRNLVAQRPFKPEVLSSTLNGPTSFEEGV